MGKTGGNINLMLVLSRKKGPAPVSESRGAAPDIQHHVENAAGHGINQLALGMFQLVVKPPDASLAGVGVVVLDKRRADAFISVSGLMIGFQEKTAVVLEHLWFHQNHFAKG